MVPLLEKKNRPSVFNQYYNKGKDYTLYDLIGNGDFIYGYIISE